MVVEHLKNRQGQALLRAGKQGTGEAGGRERKRTRQASCAAGAVDAGGLEDPRASIGAGDRDSSLPFLPAAGAGRADGQCSGPPLFVGRRGGEVSRAGAEHGWVGRSLGRLMWAEAEGPECGTRTVSCVTDSRLRCHSFQVILEVG